MARSVAVISLLLLAGSAVAQEIPSAIENCRAIEDSLLRLRCYDAIDVDTGGRHERVRGDSAEAISPPAAELGGWTIQEEINPLDDSKTVTAFLAASDSAGQQLGGPIELYLRCLSGKTEIFISWRTFLGVTAAVTTRFDKAEPKTQTWNLSTDRLSTFYPGSSIGFAAALLSANTLVGQVQPSVGPRVIATFDLTGSELAVTKVRQACGW